ncbi:MAG: hypothetical protein GY866_14225 [Proteobacteria bacterium]|nr:hypothetical protein [Pseudomonadota bacterium]
MKLLKDVLALVAVLLVPMCVFAQDPAADDTGTKPNPVYVNPDGKIFVKSKTPIYLRMSTSDDKSAPGYLLRNQGSLDASQPVKSFTFEGHGRHSILHAADHRTPQKRKGLHVFNVYDDGKSPRVKISVSKAPWVYNGNVNIYGKPVNITMQVKDEDSGVFSAYQSLNSDSFSAYDQSLVLDQEIDYKLQYYAVDNVGNQSKTRMRLYSLDFTPPSSDHKILGSHMAVNGEEVLSPRARIGLKSTDMKAGVKQTRYRFKGKRGIYKQKPLDMKGLKDGTHEIIYGAEDRVKNAESNQTFSFYLDRIPPVASYTLLGDQYRKGKTAYVSSRTTVELTAVDNKAGVKRISYYRGSEKARLYSEPFHFRKRNGKASASYNSRDNVLNLSKTETQNVVVDITAPKVKAKFKGEHYYSRKTHYVRMTTEITLPTTDNLSGIQSVSYVLDENPEMSDRKPFTISTEGSHTLVYRALDNVNNRTKDRTLTVFVDEKAPEIFHHFSVNPTIPDDQVYPLKSLLYLAATDKQAGVRTIYYRLNKGKELRYKKPLSFKRRKDYTIKVRSIDNVGNVSTSEIQFKIQ